MIPSRQTTQHEEAIDALRTSLGDAVTTVGHHYQQETVVRHCDFPRRFARTRSAGSSYRG